MTNGRNTMSTGHTLSYFFFSSLCHCCGIMMRQRRQESESWPVAMVMRPTVMVTSLPPAADSYDRRRPHPVADPGGGGGVAPPPPLQGSKGKTVVTE